jgi:hypothetical protein
MTGVHCMADTDHLIAETELLPVTDQLSLSCKQFLASAHSVVKQQSGSRPNRKDVIHTL